MGQSATNTFSSISHSENLPVHTWDTGSGRVSLFRNDAREVYAELSHIDQKVRKINFEDIDFGLFKEISEQPGALKSILSQTSAKLVPLYDSDKQVGYKLYIKHIHGGLSGGGCVSKREPEWENHLGNVVVHPEKIKAPKKLFGEKSIQEILKYASKKGKRVKAVGSGHSYNDFTDTDGILVTTDRFNRFANSQNPIDGQIKTKTLKKAYQKMHVVNTKATWKKSQPGINKALIEIEAGIKISALNDRLEELNLGLPNMGGYDGQSLAGIISTSTHGSGIHLGPLHTMVKSFVIATTGTYEGETTGGSKNKAVSFYRVEPKNGISDPTKYKHSKIQLIQDDDAFLSLVVNMGTCGIIYSAVIEVVEFYYLSEERTLKSWEKYKKELQPNKKNPDCLPDTLHQNRHVDIYLNPYPNKGKKHTMVETKRNVRAKPDQRPVHKKGSRGFFLQLGKIDFLNKGLAGFMNLFPQSISGTLESALENLETKNSPYIDKSYKVFNLGVSKDAGFALEVAIPLEDEKGNYDPALFFGAVDEMFKFAQKSEKKGQYQTSPVGIRFVDKSDAYLSFSEGKRVATIEFDMIHGAKWGKKLLEKLDALMTKKFQARVHWGLDFINGEDKLSQYPKHKRWLKLYEQFNSEKTFSNTFTRDVIEHTKKKSSTKKKTSSKGRAKEKLDS